MSTESHSDGEAPEVVPPQVGEGATDADLKAEVGDAHASDEPSASAKSAEPEDGSASGAAEPVTEDPSTAESEGDAAAANQAEAEDTVPEDAVTEEVEAKAPPPRKRSKKSEADEDPNMDVEPLELVEEEVSAESAEKHWYILKVQVNREGTIRDALERRVKIEGLEPYVDEIVVPTEDIAEFTKSGKRKITKRKLYPGYIMVNMVINDDTWFAVRETPGIGDFTGSAGKPTPMDPREVERILRRDVDEDEETQVKTSIPFNIGDHVRVKEGNFQNFEGDVDKIDEAHGLITVVINIFNRPTPVEIQYWQIEKV